MKNNAAMSRGISAAFVYDIFCREINIAISSTARNGGSDQAIEYCHNNAGLNATNAVAVIIIARLLSARCKSKKVKFTTMNAQAAFNSNKN